MARPPLEALIFSRFKGLKIKEEKIKKSGRRKKKEEKIRRKRGRK